MEGGECHAKLDPARSLLAFWLPKELAAKSDPGTSIHGKHLYNIF